MVVSFMVSTVKWVSVMLYVLSCGPFGWGLKLHKFGSSQGDF